jgi:hypothetical protein
MIRLSDALFEVLKFDPTSAIMKGTGRSLIFLIPISPIFHLLGRCRPPAVFRRIVPIVIDAIERVARRPLAHIRQKVPKIFPSLANADPSTAVEMETALFLITAPLFHIKPLCLCATAGLPVFRRLPVSGDGHLVFETSAGFRFPGL